MFPTTTDPIAHRESSKDASPGNTKKPPLSCAECRRLKLKCNRIWPCSSCEKRGLAELCPQGSLATRPRHKPPPPTPQHVLQRIFELQSRINELERALSELQATVSTLPHPLLHNRSVPYLQKKLMRKNALEKAQEIGLDLVPGTEPSPGTERVTIGEFEDIVDALGTLSIAPDGKSRFFGPTAVSEGLSVGQGSDSSQNAIRITSLPLDIVALAQSFPFSTSTEVVDSVHERIRSYLPPIDRANVLCECYFSYASFVANIVPQDDVFENIFYQLYGTKRSSHRASNSPPQADAGLQYQWHHVPPDELSLFFNVLALGALTDVATEAFSAEAEAYYQLSKALLTGQNVLTGPTLASVQSLFLGSYYEGMQSQGNSSRDCWIMMVLASKTSQIIGLHRDHSMFGLDDQEVQRRRQIFWEVHSMDLIESLAFGRPLALSCSHFDTKMRTDSFATTNLAGEVEESFYSWKYRFCAEVLCVVCDHVLGVKPPNYLQALEADRKLREFTTTYGRVARHEGPPGPNAAAQLQMMLGTRETSMLYIHRVFFAHAVSTEPANPEKSKYGKSVVTAFESARLIVEGMQYFVRCHRAFAARIWFLWNHLLSASFVLGSIVARAPGSSLAPPALTLLNNVCELLKQTAAYGGRAEYMLPVVTKLQTKGYNARMELQTGSAPDILQPRPSSEEDDELAVIGGKTRLVLHNRQSSLSPPQAQTARLDNSISVPESLPPAQLSLAASHHGYPTREQYPQTDVYSNYPSTATFEQGTYWPQEDVNTHASQMAYSLPQGGDPVFAQGSSQNLAQYAYSDDVATGPDVGSNGWQSLIRDLGV